jgi:cell division transport system permease protein
VALNIREALERLEERVEIRAFVAEGTPPEDIAQAASDIASFPEVLRADLVTQEEALKRAQAELGEFRDLFEGAVLPASIDLRLKPGQRDPATVKRVADRVKTYSFIDDVRYGEEWIEKLYRLRTSPASRGSRSGSVFAAVSMIIIGATIRMAVLARAKEISIMRLVGATDGYIRRPFLVEGFAKGVMGGLLALALTWLAQSLINRYVHPHDLLRRARGDARAPVRRADRTAGQRGVRGEAPTPGLRSRARWWAARDGVDARAARRRDRAVGRSANPRPARGARPHSPRARRA